jgi:hypothetical protein
VKKSIAGLKGHGEPTRPLAQRAVYRATVANVRQRCVEEGVTAALQRRAPRRQSLRRLDGAQEAQRLLRRLDFHYTPKHGSWLNIAEIELSVPRRQCWDQRIGDRATLSREVAAWEAARNAGGLPSTGASRPRTPGLSSSASTP